MFSKSKTKTVATKTTSRTTQVQTIVSSSYSRSNGTEITKFKSVTTGKKAMSSGSMISETRSIERFGTSTDALRGNAFQREFGRDAGEFRSMLGQNKTDAKMLTGPTSPHASSYSQSRPAPGGYRSPYRTNGSTIGAGSSQATSLYKPAPLSLTYNRPSPSSLNSSGSPLTMTTIKPPTKATSIPPLKSFTTTLSSPSAKTAERAAGNEITKSLGFKKSPKLKPGDIYIFNHEKFDNEKETRVGTKKDVEKLKQTFSGCFKMNTKVCNDFRVKDIQAEVAKIEKQDYSKKACIVIVILTHGTRHDIVCAKDSSYSIDDVILFPMLKNKTLSDKPKIFIVQACKGDNATNQFKYSDAKSPTLYAPLEIAKLYSTFEGFLSYRGEDGSLFIQILCENLQKYGKTKSVVEIMDCTISQIVTQYGSQQVPTITKNMTTPFIFGDYV